MTKSLAVLVTAALAVCAVDALAGSPSHAPHRLAAQSARTFVAPGVTLAIDDVIDDATANEAGVLVVSVTLANAGGVPLNVRYRSFALSSSADERYPALLPSELGPTAPHEVLLREGVLGTGDSMSAVLYFRAPQPRSALLELRVDLSDVHDTPIAETFVPILRTR